MAKNRANDHELAERIARKLQNEPPQPARAAMTLLQQARDAGASGLRSHYLNRAQRVIASLDPARHRPLIEHLQGQVLALQGRGRDTRIAHVSPGEIVLPRALQTPLIMRTLMDAARAAGIDPRSLRIGSGRNAINPRTGHPEFDEDELVNLSGDQSTDSPYDDLAAGSNDPQSPWDGLIQQANDSAGQDLGVGGYPEGPDAENDATSQDGDTDGNTAPELPTGLHAAAEAIAARLNDPQAPGQADDQSAAPSPDQPQDPMGTMTVTAYSPQELESFAREIFAEEQQDPSVYPALGATILNRLGQKGFVGKTDTLNNVLTAPGQFQGLTNPVQQRIDQGMLNRTEQQNLQAARAAAHGLVTGQISDPTGGATYFYSGQPNGFFKSASLTPTWKFGDFTFLK